MNNTPNSASIIANLTAKVESLLGNIEEIVHSDIQLNDDADLFDLENKLQMLGRELADHIAGIKVQEHLDKEETKQNGKNLIDRLPTRMKNMGRRVVCITMLGGNKIPVLTEYYHRNATIDKYDGKCGGYPNLLLIGIAYRQTPALESLVSLLATASASFAEAGELIQQTLGFKVDVKVVRNTVRRFAEKVRSAAELDKFEFPDDFSGQVVGVSTDGGRIRIRKNKRGHKTNKKRTRYKTDWREPKLIIIYVIGDDGTKDRKTLPLIDATLSGPDETFEMLVFYLIKLKVDSAALMLFLSDGATWIWERAVKLADQVGIDPDRCLFVLDYYHAIEHLSDMANLKRWSKEEKKRWINLQKKRLIEGRLNKFVEAINEICKGSKNKKLWRERAYFKKHLERMKYYDLKQKKLPIGSGAVESAVRRVINLRLKGPGIFWHEDSAEAMLMLRSYYKAGRWNTLKNMAYAGCLEVL